MVPRLFAGVQKPLQISVFSLSYHRACSPLFVWVGVSTGRILRGFASSRLYDEMHTSFREIAFRNCPKRGRNGVSALDLASVQTPKQPEKYHLGVP